MITKEDFLRYVKVQTEGRYNMIMDANEAMLAAGLSSNQYWDIIRNYSTYYNEFIG